MPLSEQRIDPDANDGRTRLILAAEALFATRGVHGVSDREILAVAGHRNNSAIRYHFGSRQELLDAIWYLHSDAINLHRAEMVARLPESGGESTRQLMEAHVQPLVSGLLGYTPSYWARFNEQYLIQLPTVFMLTLERDLAARVDEPRIHVLSSLLRRMQRKLTHLDAAEAAERVALTIRWVIGALASWERDVDHGVANRDTLPRLGLTVVDLGVGLLDAPATRTARPS